MNNARSGGNWCKRNKHSWLAVYFAYRKCNGACFIHVNHWNFLMLHGTCYGGFPFFQLPWDRWWRSFHQLPERNRHFVFINRHLVLVTGFFCCLKAWLFFFTRIIYKRSSYTLALESLQFHFIFLIFLYESLPCIWRQSRGQYRWLLFVNFSFCYNCCSSGRENDVIGLDVICSF